MILPRRQWLRGSRPLGVTNPPQKHPCDRDCCQDDQCWPKYTVIMRARYHDLQWYCRFLAGNMVQSILIWHGCYLRRGRCCRILRGILMRLRRLNPLGLARVRAEVPRQTRGGKPCVGPQDGKPSGRPHIETPAIHGTKNLHGFLLNPCAWLWSQPPRFSAFTYLSSLDAQPCTLPAPL